MQSDEEIKRSLKMMPLVLLIVLPVVLGAQYLLTEHREQAQGVVAVALSSLLWVAGAIFSFQGAVVILLALILLALLAR